MSPTRCHSPRPISLHLLLSFITEALLASSCKCICLGWYHNDLTGTDRGCIIPGDKFLLLWLVGLKLTTPSVFNVKKESTKGFLFTNYLLNGNSDAEDKSSEIREKGTAFHCELQGMLSRSLLCSKGASSAQVYLYFKSHQYLIHELSRNVHSFKRLLCSIL